MDFTRITVYQDSRVWVQCDHIHEHGVISLHVDLEPGVWSPGLFKFLQALLKEVSLQFKEEGYHEIYGVPTAGDSKAEKLVRMLGFEKVYTANGLLVMRIKI
jgi:hypothetical protein